MLIELLEKMKEICIQIGQMEQIIKTEKITNPIHRYCIAKMLLEFQLSFIELSIIKHSTNI